MLNKLISRRSFLAVSAMTAASFALDWKRIAAYAATMGPKSDYPTVVIGAELGGLYCAAYLAKQGIPVTVIEVKEAAPPLTNWRYTSNTEGAIYGFEQSMGNSFMRRIDNRSPIKRLYLAGAWGNPGGGFAGVLRAGEMTFQKMMEDWGK